MDSLAQIIAALPDGDGWGPPVTTETTLKGVPYAPYSKGDKLGRMADWTVDSKDGRDRGGRNQYNRYNRDQQTYGAGAVSLFAAPPAEDEGSFSVVSNVRDSAKTKFGRGAIFTRGGRGGQRGGARTDNRGGRQPVGRGGARGGGVGGGAAGGAAAGRQTGGGARGRRFGWKDYDKPARNRDASVNVKADWALLEEIDFNRLAKLNLDADEGEDLDSYGFLYYYDRTYDKQPVKSTERKLTPIDRAAYNVTTSSDPIIQELADKGEATIFATDSILSMLMCAPRSVYPWDIVIVRQGNKIFLDKRENAALDMVTVNENAADAPLDAADGSKDTVNQPNALAEEATYINHNFSNQVVLESASGAKVQMAHPNPFYNASEETEPPASKAYKYRRFDLSSNSEEEPVYLVVRTELDAVQKNATNGEDQFVSIKALNEFDSKAQGSGGALDWRAKLATQRGAVVATEMKNNSCKLARWTVQSILAKADVMKVGFVSRANPKTNDKHVILGVVGWKPRDFAAQMNLSLSNGWGIVRTIADMCLKKSDGRYVLVKDPNKSILRLYQVPTGSFDDDADEEADVPATIAEYTQQLNTLYAELLVNIRHVSVSVTLPTPGNDTTVVELLSQQDAVNGHARVRARHNGAVQEMTLPGRVALAARPVRLPLPQPKKPGDLLPSYMIWRLPVVGLPTPARGSSDDELAPWSAPDLQPRSKVSCRACSAVIVPAGRIAAWKDLPSDNWAEMMEFWHCHKPEHKHDHGHDKTQPAKDGQATEDALAGRGYGANSVISADAGIGFVDLITLLFAESDCQGLKFSASTYEHASDRESILAADSTLQTQTQIQAQAQTNQTKAMRGLNVFCASCGAQIGYYGLRIAAANLFKWQVDCASVASSAPTVADCVAATLVATIARTGSSKSVILPIYEVDEKEGSEDKILQVWVLNSNICFASSMTSTISAATASMTEPRPAIKLLFKYIERSVADDLVVKLNSDVQEINLPSDTIVAVMKQLEASNGLLPASERAFKEWRIGLMERWGGRVSSL
ncbi:eukaryotic translation initiation factor 3 subunit d [Ophiostoma piceae UAMH 11346]|uniref:Eukaryotic translation initiation factor 3 subunit D n=1 Tax=Ophiostoma piceae (strain UAMH 11346) TaxID=1262450 RepID=S3CHW0_OPHP1|nr:eukaryotic translation initiation factor 3 subunit d [Ophiostoma piceae UAMH 11346]